MPSAVHQTNKPALSPRQNVHDPGRRAGSLKTHVSAAGRCGTKGHSPSQNPGGIHLAPNVLDASKVLVEAAGGAVGQRRRKVRRPTVRQGGGGGSGERAGVTRDRFSQRQMMRRKPARAATCTGGGLIQRRKFDATVQANSGGEVNSANLKCAGKEELSGRGGKLKLNSIRPKALTKVSAKIPGEDVGGPTHLSGFKLAYISPACKDHEANAGVKL
ncbi:hypothetical protein C8F04DRAFT_1233361 [Mycena alexandri]|uniref:Uncharacterized protein n=1 Tax=Mycena alexandri TaxID=1745969 RepID=A0AAD6SXV2_9AGAR|nr:hypothetical protein C8F04DRAFT_1233361 [Mycena alexandri]